MRLAGIEPATYRLGVAKFAIYRFWIVSANPVILRLLVVLPLAALNKFVRFFVSLCAKCAPRNYEFHLHYITIISTL